VVVDVMNSLMGCDLGNICAKPERKSSENCKRKLKTLTILHAHRRERDDTNVTNDDVFRSVCSA
jgi:hypothetical protein